MKIVGFDPGFAKMGLAVVDSETMNCEVLKTFKTKKADKKVIKRLRVADDDVRRLGEIIGFIDDNLPGPDAGQFVVALESFSAFMGGYKAALGYAAMITLATKLNAGIFVFVPQDLKRGMCGKVSASKQEVWDKVLDEFEIDRSAFNKGDLEHIGDALALTILAKREQEKIEKIIGRR